MILTVTPNPAYDATYEVPALEPGEVHRVDTAHVRPGGKGVNVASVLAGLGEDVVVTGFASPAFAEDVTALGLRAALVTALPDVRRTVAVVEPGRTTSLWEPGVTLPSGAVEELHQRVAALLPGAGCVVVAGSLPPGAPDSLAADLAAQARDADVPALVDTSGAALRAAVAVSGVVLMPNAEELDELVGRCVSIADVVHHSCSLVAAGADAVVATRGREGIVATDRTGSWLAAPPWDVPGNPTGAGDAAAAAVARGLARRQQLPEIAAAAVAVSAAAVATPVAGTIDPDCYRELAGSVVVRPASVASREGSG